MTAHRSGRLAATALGVLLALGTAGCGAGDSGGSSSSGSSSSGAGAPAAPGIAGDSGTGGQAGSSAAADGQQKTAGSTEAAGRIDPTQRSVIYTVDLAVTVKNVSSAADRAAQLATAAQGYVADESTGRGSDPVPLEAGSTAVLQDAHLTLKVPVASYQRVVDQLTARDFGTVTSRKRSAQDVTDQVVDVQARITSQQASVARLQALMGQATSVTDIVALEAELARREGDLDSLLSRQKELGALSDLATITLVLSTPAEAAAASQQGFLTGLSNGWGALLDTMRVAATVLGALLPFLLLAAVVGVPVLWLTRRYRRRPNAVPADGSPAA